MPPTDYDNSVSNLGGTFPRFFILKFVDVFTKATCIPPSTPPKDISTLKGALVTQPFSCVLESEKHRCLEGAGTCDIVRDGKLSYDLAVFLPLSFYLLLIPISIGYYIVNILCVIVGIVTFWGFIKPAATKLQNLPLRAWRIEG